MPLTIDCAQAGIVNSVRVREAVALLSSEAPRSEDGPGSRASSVLLSAREREGLHNFHLRHTPEYAHLHAEYRATRRYMAFLVAGHLRWLNAHWCLML